MEFIKIPRFWINTCGKHYATFGQLENMSHPLFKGTKLHKVLTRSRKTTSVNSTLPVDSGKVACNKQIIFRGALHVCFYPVNIKYSF